MAWGRRCDLGCESWPDSDDYKTCPLCGEEATRFSNLKPLEPDEARSIVSHIKFDEYYDDRCRKLGITSSGPILSLETGEPMVLIAAGEFVFASDVKKAEK